MSARFVSPPVSHVAPRRVIGCEALDRAAQNLPAIVEVNAGAWRLFSCNIRNWSAQVYLFHQRAEFDEQLAFGAQ